MIESACKTFMPIQTLVLHRVMQFAPLLSISYPVKNKNNSLVYYSLHLLYNNDTAFQSTYLLTLLNTLSTWLNAKTIKIIRVQTKIYVFLSANIVFYYIIRIDFQQASKRKAFYPIRGRPQTMLSQNRRFLTPYPLFVVFLVHR